MSPAYQTERNSSDNRRAYGISRISKLVSTYVTRCRKLVDAEKQTAPHFIDSFGAATGGAFFRKSGICKTFPKKQKGSRKCDGRVSPISKHPFRHACPSTASTTRNTLIFSAGVASENHPRYPRFALMSPLRAKSVQDGRKVGLRDFGRRCDVFGERPHPRPAPPTRPAARSRNRSFVERDSMIRLARPHPPAAAIILPASMSENSLYGHQEISNGVPGDAFGRFPPRSVTSHRVVSLPL